jgi:protein-tyrosine phosphatase
VTESGLNHFIDIHSHILPAVDDGSVSLMQTRNMLKIAYEEGIHYIIATPHYGVGCRNPEKEELKKKLDLVQQEAGKIDPSYRVELGNELYYSEDIIEHLRKEKAFTLAGTRYVLVEFAKEDDYLTIKTGIHRLLIYGYLPILAHVESYESLYQNYEGIYDIIRLGGYMQMNIGSLTETRPNKRTVFCRKLLEYELIHILGTDSHSDYLHRAPRMREGITYLRKKYGEELLNRILLENTGKLLKNQYI